jgi:dihydrofolate reductase
MGKLVYGAIASLDGYIEDASGGFGWAEPDDEVHAFVNDLERATTTYLYGRRMYETMAGWETMDTGPDQPAVMRDFARLWREADKVVFSSTLAEPSTARTRIVPAFDPAAVRDLKSSTAGGLNIGGPTLAAHAFRAGLVDECHLFLHPVAVGGGKAALPPGMRIDLDLEDERRFAGGVVYLRYRVRPASTPPGGA